MTRKRPDRAIAGIKGRSSERGIALLMVLWILTILMVIVLSFAFMARTDVNSTVTYRQGVEDKFLAEGAVQRAIMELIYRYANRNQAMAVEGSEIVRTDGRSYRDEIDGNMYDYSITDESGKININLMTDATGIILNNLLVNLGVPKEDADTIVDSVLDWKDADDLHRIHGAEDQYYQSLPVPYKAKNANFDSLEELLFVKGVSEEILFGVGDRPGIINFLTVSTTSAIINANAAPIEVLAALPDMTREMAERIVEAREPFEIKAMQDIGGIIGGLAGTLTRYVGFADSNVYTIAGKGLGKDDQKNGFTIRAVVAVEGGNRYRYLYYKSPAEGR